MKKIITSTLILLVSVTLLQAQNKKELLLEIDALKTEIIDTKAALTEAKKNEKVGATKVESIEKELIDLRSANKMLLDNIKTFTLASSQKSDNINSTLGSLRKKEIQLKSITDAFSSNDSITLLVFSSLKKTLGENAKISASNNVVSITLDNTFLFGDPDKNIVVSPEAELFLEKIAATINANTSLNTIIETTSNALTFTDGIIDNWDLSSRQATSIARVLQTKYQVDSKNIQPNGKSDFGFDGVETTTKIRLSPKFNGFYFKLKEDMKNAD